MYNLVTFLLSARLPEPMLPVLETIELTLVERERDFGVADEVFVSFAFNIAMYSLSAILKISIDNGCINIVKYSKMVWIDSRMI